MLHIITCLSNPLNWQSRYRNIERALPNWFQGRDVHVTLVECAYPTVPHKLAHLEKVYENLTFVPVHARTVCWNRESLFNIGLRHLPKNAEWVGQFDSDITFNESDFAARIVQQLFLAHPVIQPWFIALDLGPANEVLAHHRSMGSLLQQDSFKMERPFVGVWQGIDGHKHKGHPGYAWAFRKTLLDRLDGLFPYCAIGGADRYMSLALLGYDTHPLNMQIDESLHLLAENWRGRAQERITIGYAPLTLHHMFHGNKTDRHYRDRWDILVRNDFDPRKDICFNSDGVLELAPGKPRLEQEILEYLESRNEDIDVPDLVASAA